MGNLRVLAIDPTAGNVVKVINPPAGMRWRVISMRISCTCDATVANRYIDIIIKSYPAGFICQPNLEGAVITAGNTGAMSLVPAGILATGTDFAGSYAGLAYPLELESVVSMNISISNGVAGDIFQGYALIEEYSN